MPITTIFFRLSTVNLYC